MTMFSSLSPFLQSAMAIFFLFAMILELSVFFVRRIRRNIPLLCIDLGLIAGGAFLLTGFRAHLDGNMVFASVPAIVFWVVGFLYVLWAIIGIICEKRIHKNTLTRSAIKEAFDDMPSGICFFDATGMPVLCNRTMNRLVYEMTGQDLQNLCELEPVFALPNDGNLTQPSKGQKGIWHSKDGQVWSLQKEIVTCKNGMMFTQVLAANITELFARKEELQYNNQMLMSMAQRMKRLLKNVVEIAREEEVLSMKIKIHDDIGRSVIATRQILRQNGSMQGTEPIMKLWKDAICLLKRDNETLPDTNMLTQLRESAAGIGVTIQMDGELPKDSEAAYLIVTAIRECVTNTVRHAGGTEVYVSLTEGEGEVVGRITNNGITPKSEIKEGGGLSGVRRRLEKAGGEMILQSSPRFQMTVRVPTKWKENNL